MRSSSARIHANGPTTQDPAATAADIAAINDLLARDSDQTAFGSIPDVGASPYGLQSATFFRGEEGKWQTCANASVSWFRVKGRAHCAEHETIEITPATLALASERSNLMTIYAGASSNVRPTAMPPLLKQALSLKPKGVAPMSCVWPDLQTLVPAADIAKVFSKFAGSGSEPTFDIDLQFVWSPPRPPLADRLAPRLAYLESLERGWDGYDAEPPSRRVTEQLLADLHKALEGLDVVAPTLVPGADGSLQAEWRRKGYTVFYDMGSDYERTLVVKNKERGIHRHYDGDDAIAELSACARDLLI